MKLGYWASHKYRRVSVDDVEGFVGWPYLMKLIKRCDKTRYVNRLHNERDKGLVATLFETGGRLREVLMLRKRDFEEAGDYVLVKGMRVLKRYRKVSGWTDNKGKKRWKTEPDSVTRGTFPIRIDEPLTPFMMNWVKQSRAYLFPSPKQTSKQPYLTNTRAYQIVRALGIDLHLNPHWFRAQRACQLASEYGFNLHQLLEFFKWKRQETATRYASLGWQDLAKQMKPLHDGKGVQICPR